MIATRWCSGRLRGLCGARMFSLSLFKFSPGSPASSHTPKTFIWSQLGTLTCLSVCVRVWTVVCLSMWPCGHLVTRPWYHPAFTTWELSYNPVDLSAGRRRMVGWVDAMLEFYWEEWDPGGWVRLYTVHYMSSAGSHWGNCCSAACK